MDNNALEIFKEAQKQAFKFFGYLFSLMCILFGIIIYVMLDKSQISEITVDADARDSIVKQEVNNNGKSKN